MNLRMGEKQTQRVLVPFMFRAASLSFLWYFLQCCGNISYLQSCLAKKFNHYPLCNSVCFILFSFNNMYNTNKNKRAQILKFGLKF